MVVLTTPTRAKLAALSMTARSRHACARRRCRCSSGAETLMAGSRLARPAGRAEAPPQQRSHPRDSRRCLGYNRPERRRLLKAVMAADATSLLGSAAVRSRGWVDAGLSIVVPLFNEANNLAALHARILEVARALKAGRALATEVVYVDDGSRDGTLAAALKLPADGLDIQVISLSRNFGKEAALLAGLDHARLGAVLFMDGDGQHPPALVE